MEYVKLEDIKDEILECTEDDIAAANKYVDQIARTLGVDEDKVADPVPFIVNRLGICFACYNRALMNVGTDPTTTLDGSEGKDINDQKRKLYLQELECIKEKLTAEDFTGEKRGGNSTVILFRA